MNPLDQRTCQWCTWDMFAFRFSSRTSFGMYWRTAKLCRNFKPNLTRPTYFFCCFDGLPLSPIFVQQDFSWNSKKLIHFWNWYSPCYTEDLGRSVQEFRLLIFSLLESSSLNRDCWKQKQRQNRDEILLSSFCKHHLTFCAVLRTIATFDTEDNAESSVKLYRFKRFISRTAQLNRHLHEICKLWKLVDVS